MIFQGLYCNYLSVKCDNVTLTKVTMFISILIIYNAYVHMFMYEAAVTIKTNNLYSRFDISFHMVSNLGKSFAACTQLPADHLKYVIGEGNSKET